MKTSFCSISYRKTKKNLEQMFYEVSKAGYDGIEIWERHVNKNSPHELLSLKNSFNISIPIISIYTDFTGSDGNFKRSIKEIERFSKIADYLRCPLIRIFTGNKSSKFVTSIEWAKCIKGLKFASIIAKKHNVKLAIETHPDTLLDGIEPTLHLMQNINNTRIGINLDIWHIWQKEHNLKKILDKLYKYVLHIHVKNALDDTVIDTNDSQNRLRTLDEGALNYRIFFKELLKRNYNNYISVEWFGRDPDKAVKHEIHFIRSFLNETHFKKHL